MKATRPLGAVIGAIVLTVVGLAAADPTTAFAHTSPTADPSIAAYVVHAGDGLSSIARRFGTTPATLTRLNTLLENSVIHPGDVLLVPTAVPGPTSVSPQPQSSPVASTTYVVKRGDYLVSIASRNGLTLAALLSLNQLTASSMIQPGQILLVPQTQATTQPIPTAITNAPASPTETLVAYLRLQEGKPYKFFTAGPETFDCSGLVVAGFRQIGKPMPHQSRALAELGRPVDLVTETIQAGDLIFMKSSVDPTQIGHVGVALTADSWIQAVGTGKPIRISAIPAATKIEIVRRLLP